MCQRLDITHTLQASYVGRAAVATEIHSSVLGVYSKQRKAMYCALRYVMQERGDVVHEQQGDHRDDAGNSTYLHHDARNTV